MPKQTVGRPFSTYNTDLNMCAKTTSPISFGFRPSAFGFPLVVLLAPTGLTDTVHKINQRQEHGNNDTAYDNR